MPRRQHWGFEQVPHREERCFRSSPVNKGERSGAEPWVFFVNMCTVSFFEVGHPVWLGTTWDSRSFIPIYNEISGSHGAGVWTRKQPCLSWIVIAYNLDVRNLICVSFQIYIVKLKYTVWFRSGNSRAVWRRHLSPPMLQRQWIRACMKARMSEFTVEHCKAVLRGCLVASCPRCPLGWAWDIKQSRSWRTVAASGIQISLVGKRIRPFVVTHDAGLSYGYSSCVVATESSGSHSESGVEEKGSPGMRTMRVQ